MVTIKDWAQVNYNGFLELMHHLQYRYFLEDCCYHIDGGRNVVRHKTFDEFVTMLLGTKIEGLSFPIEQILGIVDRRIRKEFATR